MTVCTRFDSALAGRRWTGTVETESDQSAIAVPDSSGPRLVLLAPGRDLVPWGAEVSWYVPPRQGGRVEIAFEGPGVDLSVEPARGPAGECPLHLLGEAGSEPGAADRVVGALAAATRLAAPWLDGFRAAVRALPRDVAEPAVRERLDHAADGRFPEALCHFVRALGDVWLPPLEVRVLANRVVTRSSPRTGSAMLQGADLVTGGGI